MASFAPRRPCARCGRLVDGRCAYCRRRQDGARGSASLRGYDETWANYARAWLRFHPWCGERADGTRSGEHSRCAARGERVRADVVDHITPIKAGGARLEADNHQSLCRSCNAAKAAGADVEAIRRHTAYLDDERRRRRM
jgi:5-methylcytosine-specific restriction endonuclease McrA